MAKMLTPLNPVSFPAFHISEQSLEDVMQLGQFAAYNGYIANLRCNMEIEGRPPVWTITLVPRGVEARKTMPTLTVQTGDWVTWENGAFIVKPDADVAGMYDIAQVPSPVPAPAIPDNPDPEPEPEP